MQACCSLLCVPCLLSIVPSTAGALAVANVPMIAMASWSWAKLYVLGGRVAEGKG